MEAAQLFDLLLCSIHDGRVVDRVAQDLPGLEPFFAALPTSVVIDHMGRPDVKQPVDGAEFERFVRFMREHGNV